MSKNAALLVLLVVFLTVALAGRALAGGETTVIVNNTNACIDSTFKSWYPSMANPSLIVIDRRVNFNPTAGCTSGVPNNAGCYRGPGNPPTTPAYLQASAYGSQINQSPACVWNCAAAGCGTIITDGPNEGLPVELMDFAIEGEPAAGAPGQSGEGAGDFEDGWGPAWKDA